MPGQPCCILWLLCSGLLAFILRLAYANEAPLATWYVSAEAGKDGDGCGYSMVAPCRSLVYTFTQLAEDHHVICIDGGGAISPRNYAYDMCADSRLIFSTVQSRVRIFELRGYNGVPRIGCLKEKEEDEVDEVDDAQREERDEEESEYEDEEWGAEEYRQDEKGNEGIQHLNEASVRNSRHMENHHKTKRNAEQPINNYTVVHIDSEINHTVTYKIERPTTVPESTYTAKPSIEEGTEEVTPKHQHDITYPGAIDWERFEQRNNCNISLIGLELVNGLVSLANCSVQITRVTFRNASLAAAEVCKYLAVTVVESVWHGNPKCEQSHYWGGCKEQISNLTCFRMHVKLHNTSFYQTSVTVEGRQQTTVSVTSSLFSNHDNQYPSLGGLHITFSAMHAYIFIRNSTFSKQVFPSRVQGLINLYHASLWLKSSVLPGFNSSVAIADASIVDCVFADNERALTLLGPFSNVLLERVWFIRNMVLHAGAALLVLLDGESPLIIRNSTFRDNVAGRFRSHYPIQDTPGELEIHGSVVQLNTACCNGVVELVGKGGAVRVQRGKAQITQCTFINNTARLLGGSVFVDINGSVDIQGAYFENTATNEHALQGDVLYSDGKLKVNDVKLIVRSAENGLSIFRHSGDHWTLEITNVWIECPIGFDLRSTNSSVYGVTQVGLRRAYKLDQLSYFCESCPMNKYSLDHGYLNYTTDGKREFAYFTLLINGSEPTAKFNDKFEHHQVQCKDCPYGGHCAEGIKSVANFWGYAQNESIRFQHCPRGYCCAAPICPSLNHCSEHRHGRLCGRCMEGYSEALFSPRCIPNEKCRATWMYLLSGTVGLAYTVFLLYQADLQAFLFAQPLQVHQMLGKLSQRRRQTQLNRNQGRHHHYSNGSLHASTKSTTLVEDTQFLPNGDVANGNKRTNARVLTKDYNTMGKASETFVSSQLKKQEYSDQGFGSGFLVIMFYYFQDALLLNVNTVFVKEVSKWQQLMKSILAGIFKFQIDLSSLLEGTCAYPDMTAVPNLLAKAMIVPYVISLFIVTFILYKLGTSLRRSQPIKTHHVITISSQSGSAISRKSFASRLASGFILALLFMFQKLGVTTFLLLNCVPIGEETVLFIDGEVVCYERWQYIVMAYAVTFVTPFFLVLLFGPGLLQRARISLTEFFLASLCPLPFLCRWLIRYIWGRCIKWRQNTRRTPTTPSPTLTLLVKPRDNSIAIVLLILQGPFRHNRYDLCWSGVLIGRRLILILLSTFVTDSLIRLLLMLLCCFVILLHHSHAKPYRDVRGNLAGTFSAAALVVLCSINLVRAGFEAAEYTPSGPNSFLMHVFNEVENVLLLWGPLAILVIIGLVFAFRIVSYIWRSFCGDGRRMKMDDGVLYLRGNSAESD